MSGSTCSGRLCAAPVFLVGMPRSGTTWLSQIVESAPECAVRLSPNFSYPLKHRLSPTSAAIDWERVLERALHSRDPFMTQDYRRATGELDRFGDKSPQRVHTLAIKDTRFHDVYLAGMERLPRARLVYIVRHPAACLWSWRNCKEFPVSCDFMAHWRSGACRKDGSPGEYWGFDDWKHLGLLYCRRAAEQPSRYHVLRYEDLVARALVVTQALFAFLGLPVGDETRTFLRQSQARHDPRPYAVFKSRAVAHAWRSAFPRDVLRCMEAETRGSALERFVQ